MMVDLTPELEQALKERVASGKFSNTLEVIEAALAALSEKEHEAHALALAEASIERYLSGEQSGRPWTKAKPELDAHLENLLDARARPE